MNKRCDFLIIGYGIFGLTDRREVIRESPQRMTTEACPTDLTDLHG